MYSLIDSTKRKTSDTADEPKTVKQARSVTSGLASISITPEDSVTPTSPPNSPIEIDVEMDTEFKPAATWKKVKELIITSSEFTARDKKEILAQSSTFENMEILKDLASANEGGKKEALVNIYNQASKQLTLYYSAARSMSV